ncbi:enoyl-CoA hydratase/carnithine racemase [Paucimonas lemoignei]|uniref:Enoyl-CoA hydratase/carnithine racemase n=1 Tax=Paucimonas lemoignei TaxID=29443 RepID=A0A4V2UI88_PAULE|nr:enoyl-CoA hydratase-related protein [Paucimonas lemoignei]TCS34371.1 enoyl-CoA hydratase/carnithine racemase [Paucimonas lemoignei]
MEMKDEIRLEARRAVVWEALNDPEVLKACIPGCESLEKNSDTELVSLVVVKVGPIKAKFSGKVTLTDIVPMESYRLIGEGQGGVAGFAKAEITVQLEDEGASTLLRYGVTANIGGKIAQLGSRMIDSTARKMADQFFASFNEVIQSRTGAAQADAGAAAVSGVAASSGETASTSVATAVPEAGGAMPVSDDILVTLVDVQEEDEPPVMVQNNSGGWLARLLGRAQAAPAQPAAKVPASNGVRHKAAIVTLNRPKQRNAVTLQMWRDLGRIFTELGRDPKVRAIILTGAGGNFSGGADIAEFSKVRASVEQGVEYEVAVDACCDAIAATPKPTIAVVNGYCMGGACHLAMSCDFRVAATSAQFGIPAARLSIVYGVRGTQRLLALVGVANAKRILYSAKKFGAEEGHRIGFVDRVAADPMRAAKSFAAVMADNAPLTIAGTKVLLNGLTMGMGVLNDTTVRQVVERAVGSDDYRDARQAFVEKRQPVFLGK